MKSDDIIKGLSSVGQKHTRQVKAEEKSASARRYRGSMYTVSRRSLKSICFEYTEQAWERASGGGMPTSWRQVFYKMRPVCDQHPESDRPLTDKTFKHILEEYLDEFEPGWDVLYGARGFFKEPHAAENDSGLPMGTANVRNYLAAGEPATDIPQISARFPTHGATNRIAAVLICEKEGFDEQLMQAGVTDRFDLALMSTKGISAHAARDLARSLEAPCFTLHDFDKNGFVMAAGFPFATDLGIRMDDIAEWGLEPEDQHHQNPNATRKNLVRNGATHAEADFISEGQRVELNEFASDQFIGYVEAKLEEHGVEKVVPDDETLKAAWERAHRVNRLNRVIAGDEQLDTSDIPPAPDDLADHVREAFQEGPARSWDDVLADMPERAL